MPRKKQVAPKHCSMIANVILGSTIPVHAATIKAAIKGVYGVTVSPRSIRLSVNYLRKNNLIPFLLSGNDGYYVSDNPEHIQQFIHRMRGEAIEMMRISKALKTQYFEKMNSPKIMFHEN